ncbi:MAG: efflux RND transporter periplasmic adaptor subunit [Acidobacteriota bacterium]
MREPLITAIALLALLAGCSREPPPAQPPPARAGPAAREVLLPPAAQKEAGVETETVQVRSIPELLRASGRITEDGEKTWRVGAVTEGRIVKVFASPGDTVRQGQILARMHSHAIHESRAEYRKALGDLTRVRAQDSYARGVRDRARRLFGLKAASLEQVEHAETELRNAQTAVTTAEVELDRTRRHLVEFLEIPPDEQEYHRDGAPHLDEDLIPIKSPAGGVVLVRNVTAGTVVGTSADLFVISDLATLWMIAAVSEEHLARLRASMPVRVSVQAYPGRVFPGRIGRLGEELDPTTRTLRVRVELPNPGGRLKPEMYAAAEIELGGSARAVFIPQTAPQEIEGQTMVFVRKAEDRFEARPVRIARAVEGSLEVAAGLAPGEVVVTRGSFLLKSQLLKSSLAGE